MIPNATSGFENLPVTRTRTSAASRSTSDARGTVLASAAMRAPLLFSIAAVAVLLACSSDDKSAGASSSSGSSDGGAGAPPDPSVLFDTLPAASPEKLRGVWETKESSATGTITIRLRFTELYLGGVARCTTPAGKTLDAPQVVGIQTTDVDKKDGTFGMPDGITFAAAEGDFKCKASLPGGNIKFTIAATALKLSIDGVDGTIDFTKVGD